MPIILMIFLLFISIMVIWKSSDWLTDSLVPVAERLGTSYIAVASLLVSFALSIPEIFTAIYTTLLGHLTIGLGVIIGSVMANIGLTIGLSAMWKPLKVEKSVVVRDGIYLVVAAVIVLIFGSDLQYTRSEGAALLVLFIPYALNVWFFEKWRPHKSKKEKASSIKKNLSLPGWFPKIRMKASLLTFFLSALILVGGSYLFSFTLINLNEVLKIPELLLGLTAGALGPVMPNIAAALQGTKKGYKDAALTETFGSNIFTLLITLGVITIMSPFFIAGSVFYFDLTWMIIIHLLMLAFIIKGYHYREESLTRFEGIALLVFYLVLLVVHLVMF